MAMMTETQYGTGFSQPFSFGLKAACKAALGAMRFRVTLNILAQLDDHILRDIGLTQDDLLDLRMASLPSDAVKILLRSRRSR